PCRTGVLRVCFELSITIWVTPRNGLTKLQTSRPLCFTAAFPESPNGFTLRLLQHFPRRPLNLCITYVLLRKHGKAQSVCLRFARPAIYQDRGRQRLQSNGHGG